METRSDSGLPEPHQWSQGQSAARAFSNEVIDAAALPDFRRAALERVSARFAPYAMISSAIFWLLLVIASVVGPRLPMVEFELPTWLPLVPASALIWFATVAGLDARRRRWALREHDLIYRSGLIWQSTAILPFSRIQHVETASGPLERLFGLMRVKCFTAGGLAADLTVEGLEHDDARRVRQYLLEQIRDDEAAAADGEPEQ